MKKKEVVDEDDLPNRFWKGWEEANELEQTELIAKLPFIKNYPKHVSAKTFALVLNTYFEDLYEYAATKKAKTK
jgi:hypothetical protein